MANGQRLKAKKKIAKAKTLAIFLLPLNRCGAGDGIVAIANFE